MNENRKRVGIRDEKANIGPDGVGVCEKVISTRDTPEFVKIGYVIERL